MGAYFYVLHSRLDGKYYVGHTSGLLCDRLRKHNSSHKGFTGGYGDWVVVYKEEYPSKADAFRRERQVEAWKSLELIKSLIAGSEHPG